MAKDPENEAGRSDASKGLSRWLDSFARASSEHKKTVVILDDLVPYLQSKGTNPLLSPLSLENVFNQWNSIIPNCSDMSC